MYYTIVLMNSDSKISMQCIHQQGEAAENIGSIQSIVGIAAGNLNIQISQK